MRITPVISRWLGTALVALALIAVGGIADFGSLNGALGVRKAAAQSGGSVRPPTRNADKWTAKKPGDARRSGGDQQKWGSGGALPTTKGPQKSRSNMWSKIRKGVQGTVSQPNEQLGFMIQSGGEKWRQYRNSTLFNTGAWILLVTVAVIALFFVFRRRIKVDAGLSGRTVVRFKSIDRFAHWLTATSFIVLGLTGLNMLYGKSVIMPIIGKPAFAWLTQIGKLAHDFIGYAFIVGIVMMLFLWIRQNLPDRYDIPWLMKGGGILTKAHPAAGQFNTGQKFIFWSVMIGGGIIAYTGVLLMFPGMAAVADMQSLQIWHSWTGLVLIAIIIGHIYIGSLGMVGAFQAMGSGEVDENWARQHHSAWADKVIGGGSGGGG